MNTRKVSELLRHGDDLAEVEVEWREYPGKEWRPTLSLDDVRKLERLRKALERGDIPSAAKDARVFRVTAVTTA